MRNTVTLYSSAVYFKATAKEYRQRRLVLPASHWVTILCQPVHLTMRRLEHMRVKGQLNQRPLASSLDWHVWVFLKLVLKPFFWVHKYNIWVVRKIYKCNARQFETYKFVNNKITWVVDELSDNALWQYYNSCSTKNETKNNLCVYSTWSRTKWSTSLSVVLINMSKP